MTEEKRSIWQRLLSVDPRFRHERERRVIQYIVHRVSEGASIREAVAEEYVRRNLSQAEVDDLFEDPELMEALHEQVRNEFSSMGEPKPPPSAAQ